MKNYIKPYIEEETIEIEDIIAVSAGGEGTESVGNIWDDLEPEE